jgi:hypothetical protein
MVCSYRQVENVQSSKARRSGWGINLSDTSRELLDAAYSRLGFAEGDLLQTTASSTDTTPADWLSKGDWLALGKKVGAEKIFFVNDYPVIVFAEQLNSNPADWTHYFNSIWCMARPQILFLARDGELSVFNLTKKPARPGELAGDNNRLLETVKATADVQDRLNRYRREQVESGRLFEDDRFGFEDRADRALIRDLGRVRKALIATGLNACYAHALIGRSIFIRYLEDRLVLTDNYFINVAKKDHKNWLPIVKAAIEKNPAPKSSHSVIYPHILKNKSFTYSLFNRLAKEFNGDMFPVDQNEERAVTEQQLQILSQFLLGELGESTQNLFFFAYRFDIIPIELISSIYEKFYSFQPTKRREDGSYYTPSSLVDFVLSDALSEDILRNTPRILDPACGSGIFLVEAFRRIVRYRVSQEKRPLSALELHAILKNQIAGIDISAEAIRVAAFSLYLAMLHYLDPPDILQHQLPCLTYSSLARRSSSQRYDILLVADAFSVSEAVSHRKVRDNFLSKCADVVVGNPPWGAPPSNVPKQLKSDGGSKWCSDRQLSVGDKERSQAFIHRTLDLLKDNGRAALLVSTGVFFKRHKNTKLFRHQWLKNCTLKKVVNFAAVRNAFFRSGGDEGTSEASGAIAPFAAVIFDKIQPEDNSRFTYWSAKETALVKRVQAVILNIADIRSASQAEYINDEALWKIYWWGGHRDEAAIRRLRLETTLSEMLDPENKLLQSGFKEVSKDYPSGWLKKFKEFPSRIFERYGPLPDKQFINPPPRVERRRERRLYEGPRLLVKRGISSNDLGQGQIVARFETESFCYRHSIYGLPLRDITQDDAKIVLGILWSSITRYYLFMTSGTWGLWHDELLKETLSKLPVRLSNSPQSQKHRDNIIKTVDLLRSLPIPTDDDEGEETLFSGHTLSKDDFALKIRSIEKELNSHVYKLFELTNEDQERIEEFCTLGLDLFYRGMKSDAVLALDWPSTISNFGRYEDLLNYKEDQIKLTSYIKTFLNVWNPALDGQNGRLRWRVVRPKEASSMLAILFETESLDAHLPDPKTTDEQEWANLLVRLDESSRMPTNSSRIYIDGVVRIVTDSEIVIIKRNEHRLWTASVARDDAESTMVIIMNGQN